MDRQPDCGTRPTLFCRICWGLAIRFRIALPPSSLPSESSQDILLLTARRVIPLGIAALHTDQTDFLANHYYGLTHFQIGSIDKIELRIRVNNAPDQQDFSTQEHNRYDKLHQAAQAGEATFLMEALTPDARNQWQPIVAIKLLEELAIEQNALEFWPFRSAQNIVPRGFINFLRPIPYVFSQYARAVVPHSKSMQPTRKKRTIKTQRISPVQVE